jgi:hypothetical protein
MDKIVMLLSTDWFFPHWEIIGANGAYEQRFCLQSACREIVQQIIGGARDYYQASFTPERLQATDAMLIEALRKCRFHEDTISQMHELVTPQESGPCSNESFAWTLSVLTKKLLIGQSGLEAPGLDPFIENAVARAYAKYSQSELNFKDLCSNSPSPWDQYIRELTPDLPSSMAEYLSERLLPQIECKKIWADLANELSPEQLDELRTWYRNTAERSMGLDTHDWPPPWKATI